jgi:hypothetical protein
MPADIRGVTHFARIPRTHAVQGQAVRGTGRVHRPAKQASDGEQ